MITTGILTTAEFRRKDSPVIPSGRIWPNGDFGIGFRRKLEKALNTTIPVQVHPDGAGVGAWFGLLGVMQEISVTLGLSVLRNSRKPKTARPETYGRKGITGFGRKMVSSGATILEREYGKERLSFLTLTVPEIEGEGLKAIAEGWAGLVNRLVEYLRRKLKKAGLPTEVCGCVELQPKRTRGGSLGALHLHVVFVGRFRYRGWALKPLEIREWWLNALGRVTGYPIVSGSCENIQGVRKSAARYLGKYMSKGVKDILAFAEISGWSCVPRQWWTMTSKLKAKVKREILSGETIMGILETVVNWKKHEESPEGFKFLGQVTIPVPGYPDETMGVGWFGTLERGFHQELKELASAL
jgi:hypothetical protein